MAPSTRSYGPAAVAACAGAAFLLPSSSRSTPAITRGTAPSMEAQERPEATPGVGSAAMVTAGLTTALVLGKRRVARSRISARRADPSARSQMMQDDQVGIQPNHKESNNNVAENNNNNSVKPEEKAEKKEEKKEEKKPEEKKPEEKKPEEKKEEKKPEEKKPEEKKPEEKKEEKKPEEKKPEEKKPEEKKEEKKPEEKKPEEKKPD